MVNKSRLKDTLEVRRAGDLHQLHNTLTKNVQPHSTLLLALSGGVDSVVLLHQLYRLRERLSFQLHAMHVHHGLSPNANEWAAHCQWLCQQYEVPLTIKRVPVLTKGSGVEAAARQARYQALFDYECQSVRPDWVLTAHHQADQAETFLLQLFRGAGVKGLSSMPSVSDTRLLRPMLHVAKPAIMDYASRHKLRWCEDESNSQLKYDRNYIRQQVTPILKMRYPSVDETLAKAANQMAEAQSLLTELAKQDAIGAIETNRLNIACLSTLSDSRFKNVLRYWLDHLALPMPSSKKLTEMSKQLRDAPLDASVRLEHQAHVLLRYDGFVYCYQAASLPDSSEFELNWNGESALTLPNGCKVHFNHVVGQGIALKHLSVPLLVRSRRGGERLKLNALRPEKSLKQWFQEAKIPPWVRDVTPLLTLAGKLVYVPGVGVASDFVAGKGQPGLLVTVDFVK